MGSEKLSKCSFWCSDQYLLKRCKIMWELKLSRRINVIKSCRFVSRVKVELKTNVSEIYPIPSIPIHMVNDRTSLIESLHQSVNLTAHPTGVTWERALPISNFSNLLYWIYVNWTFSSSWCRSMYVAVSL
jgi:hypothetical protein